MSEPTNASRNAAPAALTPEQSRREEQRAKLGLALIVAGLLGILWGVFHVLNGLPTAEKLDFAHRMTDYQARKSVHENFPGGLLRALCGLGVALWGGRVRGAALRALGRADD
ncbi:MAG: hypothetical protein JNN27_07755 [Planctomycetes bacterium]|nr:hypothetical protein [Planctomycetota bacterium]